MPGRRWTWGGLAGFRENLGTIEDRSRKAAIELTNFCAKQHFIILPQLGNFSHHVTHVLHFRVILPQLAGHILGGSICACPD